jgi:hypothetical protein
MAVVDKIKTRPTKAPNKMAEQRLMFDSPLAVNYPKCVNIQGTKTTVRQKPDQTILRLPH